MSLSHRFGLRVACLAILLSLGVRPAWPQATSTSTVAGLVTDQQNAVMPNAEVRLTDTATNIERTTSTNEAGRYVFVNVRSGTYNIAFSKPGFAVYRVAAQQVTIGSTLTINVTLEVGTTTTTVEVSATAAAELQTTNAAVGTTLGAEALLLLPNMGRDVSTLAVLQPGVSPAGFTAGAIDDQNTFTLDGGINSDDMAGNTLGYQTNFVGTGGTQTSGAPSGVVPTPVESVEEFRVQTFNQTSDFNSSIGSNVQMVTKRGTNQYHGSGYGYYFATNVGAANSWTNNHTPTTVAGVSYPYTPLPKNHRSRFGTSFGGTMLPKMVGGKTYFFFNYEGSRFPNVSTYERTVPTKLLRAGVIQVPNSAGQYVAYNLNPAPVTVDGVTYNPAMCGSGPCDPRGIGLNPIVTQIWEKYMPLPNNPQGGDNYNTQGFRSVLRAPLTSNSYVGRIDHDFGERNHFFAMYRYANIINLTNNQVDIGGALPGDTFGVPIAKADRPQKPSIWVLGLTTMVRPTITNEFRANYTRQFWQWGSSNAPPQVAGLGGAVEVGGESLNALIPYNVNTQNTRQRFWDGQDKLLRDDMTMLKGNHLIQFGGSYQRNYDFHMRTDNGQGINNQIVYQVTNAGINFGAFPYPSTVPTTQQSNWNTLYSEVLGLVNQPQVAYTRSGASLALQPVGAYAYERSVIPYYNAYWSDTWHLKKSFTLTYGLSYGLEMPPYELNGNQVSGVGPDGAIIDTKAYQDARKAAALTGQVYQPLIGFALTPNAAGHPKYPYDPFYLGLSPRVSAAWNPSYDSGLLGKLFGHRKTVIRGGYGRIWGRVNGVNQVLVPLLGPGLLQAVACNGPSKTGQCLGTNNVDASTVFRIGTDGMTAPLPAVPAKFPQPYIPGVDGAPANDATVLDKHYIPQRTENFTFTIQRQTSQKSTLEVGYMGRIIRHEYQEINLDAVPHMTTLGGQSFAQAWANIFWPVNSSTATSFTLPAQPFFENALSGNNSASCAGFANCTSMLASTTAFRNFIRNGAVSDFWAAMYKLPSWTLARSMISQNLPTSLTGGLTQSQGTAINETTTFGFGNYNALFVTFRMRDWHGISATSNFTWGRALGVGALRQYNSSNTTTNPWDLHTDYGLQSNDIKFIYNAAIFWQSSNVFRQRGVLGHLLGGWIVSPLLTAQSGGGAFVGYSEGSCSACQAFGEVTPPASSTSASEGAVGAAPFTGGTSAHYNVRGSNGVGTNNPTGVNMFEDPATIITQFRKCVLGFDNSCGGYYNLRGFPRWNVDAALAKDIGFWKEGRIGATFSFQFTNIFNHVVMTNPTLTITSPTTFGRTTSQANTPRNLEFGLRIHF
jgi:hypothetical protein